MRRKETAVLTKFKENISSFNISKVGDQKNVLFTSKFMTVLLNKASFKFFGMIFLGTVRKNIE